MSERVKAVEVDAENGIVKPSLGSEKSNVSLEFQSLKSGANTRFGGFSIASLTWSDLKVTATIDTGKGPKCLRGKKDSVTKKEILKGVSGICQPGTFTAIMGASGAGKTTLLNTLARKNKLSLKESGTMLVNGHSLTPRMLSKITAYVQQEDYFIGTLTVQEVLMFHAVLRMDPRLSGAEKKARVKQVMKELGLMKIANSLCGAPGGMIRGISGGERKRLSVACELLMNPPLLFIDEPTSGLDSFMAMSIVRLIQKLAKANRTILCTIHQPTSEVFAMFDRLYLVAEGGCAFTGTCEEGLQFFKQTGYPCPANFNPADHYIFNLAIIPGSEKECHARVEEIKTKFADSDFHKQLVNDIAEQRKSSKVVTTDHLKMKRTRGGFGLQVKANFYRSAYNIIRNPSYTKIRIFQALVLSLLGGLAYLQLPNNQESFQDKSGLLFFVTTTLTFGNVFTQTQSIPMELPIIKREFRNGMYGTLSYLVPKIFLEVVYLLPFCLIQWAVLWALAGLTYELDNFLVGYLNSVLIAYVSVGVGYAVSCLAGNVVVAGALTPLVILPFFLFGGLYQNEDSTPKYFIPIKYASWFKYGFSTFIVNEFKGLTLECPSDTETSRNLTNCRFPDGAAVLNYFHIEDDEIWFPNCVALAIMGTIYYIIAFLFLYRRVSHRT